MEKPILFNTEMVQAILEGRKTQTRRIIKPQPDNKHQSPLGYVIGGCKEDHEGYIWLGNRQIRRKYSVRKATLPSWRYSLG